MQVLLEGAPGGVHTQHRGANMGHTAMVPRDTGVTGRVPDSSSNTPESVARSIQQATPPVGEQPTTVSRVESIWGKVTLQRALQRGLQTSFCLGGALERMPRTSLGGPSGVAGVLQ